MVTVSGPLKIMTDKPSRVSEVWVGSPQTRPHGGGLLVEERDKATPVGGVLSFTSVPGPVLLTLVSGGRVVDSVKGIVPDTESATLAEVVRAAGLADAGTLTALEELALEVAADAARVGTAAQVEVWADQAEGAASDAAAAAEAADNSASAASGSATTAATASNSVPGRVTTEINTQLPPKIDQLVPPKVAEVIGSDTIIRDAAAAAVEAEAPAAVDAAVALAMTTKADVSFVQTVAFGAAAALMDSGPSTPPGEGGEWSPDSPIYLWGDSAIDRGSAGARLADGLKNAVYQDVVDNAVGGSTMDNALIRMGAIQLFATPVGGQIPADPTPVMVNLHGGDVGMMTFGQIPVTWAGVSGVMEYSNTIDTGGWVGMRFTRSGYGTAVTVSTPDRLIPDEMFDPYSTHIIVSGGNDRRSWIGTTPEDDKIGHLVGGYIKAVEMSAAAPGKHILIGGLKTRSDTMPGDSYHQMVVTVNTWLKELFPHLFVDRGRWLAERAPEILGLTLTESELIQQAAGIVPASVFADETHTQAALFPIEGKELWAAELAVRGWAQTVDPITRHSMPITAGMPLAATLSAEIDDLKQRLAALEATP